MTESENIIKGDFRPRKTYAISPKIQFNEAASPINSRYAVMSRLQALFIFNQAVLMDNDGKEIEILQTSDDFIQNDKYWGGDAILVTVPAQYNGEEISKSLQSEYFVVYDQSEDRYFVDGAEIKPDFRKPPSP